MTDLKKQYSRNTSSGIVLLSRMTSNGQFDGPGDLTVDGSVTPVEFWIEPAVDMEAFVITEFLIVLSDGGTPSLDEYGNQPTLTNGIQFFLEIKGQLVLIALPVKTNQELIEAGGIFQDVTMQADDIRTYRFNFPSLNSPGQKLLPGDRFGVVVQDDLSALTSHRVIVNGIRFPRVVPA